MANVVVFDMGGVLFDFQGDRLIAETSRRARRWRSEEVQKGWPALARAYETGASSEAEFAAAVRGAYDLDLTAAEFSRRFRAAAVGYYPGALTLVTELAASHRLVSLSNTNPLQWPEVLAPLADQDPFSAHHPSHLSGFHKPDRRAFEAVMRAHSADSDFYFLDDRAENVAVATTLGWRARRVRGVVAARSACRDFGLLPAGS